MSGSHDFDLTNREQRTILAIVILILAVSVAIHYRDLTTPMPKEKPAATTPALSNTEEDAAPNE